MLCYMMIDYEIWVVNDGLCIILFHYVNSQKDI